MTKEKVRDCKRPGRRTSASGRYLVDDGRAQLKSADGMSVFEGRRRPVVQQQRITGRMAACLCRSALYDKDKVSSPPLKSASTPGRLPLRGGGPELRPAWRVMPAAMKIVAKVGVPKRFAIRMIGRRSLPRCGNVAWRPRHQDQRSHPELVGPER